MAFRLLSGAMQGKYACVLPSNTATNYLPVSSDAGKILMASSNLGRLMQSTTQNTATYGSDQYLGIFVKPEYENDESSCSTFGSTSCKLWFQPIVVGDILEVDYSTDATHSSGTSGDLHTTNIGMFYRTGFTSDSTTAAQMAVNRSYLNVTTGGAVVDNTTGRVFKLIDYTTENKTAIVQYLPADLCS
jgi:hypothetical protein